MFVCKHCGQTFPTYTTICSKCGNAVVETPTAHTQPPYAPSYGYGASPAPYVAGPEKPTPSGGAKAMGILGLLMGIEGLIVSVISVIYGLYAVFSAQYYAEEYYSYYYDYYYYDALDFYQAFMVFVIIQLFITIVGLVLSCVSRGKGFGGAATVGKVFNIISIVFVSIALVLSIAAVSEMRSL